MKLYHGSTYKVKNTNVDKGRNNTDFGKGFSSIYLICRSY